MTINLHEIQKTSKMKVGDYLSFGSYATEPILWRVIHFNESGDPLILSKNILCLKAFDVSIKDRLKFSSNEWETSQIRNWLNSCNEGTCIDLILSSIIKAHDTENGFLSDDNFTPREQTLIKPTIHKVLLAKNYIKKKNGGTELHKCTANIAKALQNYDNAYYKSIEDKVFLLSVNELHNFVYKNGFEYKAKPTKKALEHTEWKHKELDCSKYWTFWLRTPYATDSRFVRYVSYTGHIRHRHASDSFNGIRPALYLDGVSINLLSGIGTELNPYVILT